MAETQGMYLPVSADGRVENGRAEEVATAWGWSKAEQRLGYIAGTCLVILSFVAISTSTATRRGASPEDTTSLSALTGTRSAVQKSMAPFTAGSATSGYRPQAYSETQREGYITPWASSRPLINYSPNAPSQNFRAGFGRDSDPMQQVRRSHSMQPVGAMANTLSDIAEGEEFPTDSRVGTEVPEDVLSKGYSDLSGMKIGDVVAIQRSDGKWMYGQAMYRTGLDSKNIGAALNFKADQEGSTKKFIRAIEGDATKSDWDKIKALNPPQPGKGILTDRPDFDPTAPLMAKIGMEASEDEVKDGSPVSPDMNIGDFVAMKSSDGKWKYTRFYSMSGSNRAWSGGDAGAVGPGKTIELLVDADGNKIRLKSNEWDDLVVLKEIPK